MRVMLRNTSRRLSGAHTTVFWNHLQGDAPRRHRGLPARAQDAQSLDHPVPAFGGHGAFAGEGRVRSVLSVEVVVLATPPAIVLVGCCDLQDLDTGLL